MRLLNQLEGQPDRCVLTSSDGTRHSLESLRSWSTSPQLATWSSPLDGTNVGVCCRDNGKLALLLLALDGIAGRLTLLPTDLSSAALTQIASAAGVEVLIGDSEDAGETGIRLHGLCPLPHECPGISEESVATDHLTEWVLPTSGTTRTPKLVAHTVATLTRTVKRDQKQGAELKWGLLYDLNRFAGLQVFFQSLVGGASLIIPGKESGLPETLALFRQEGCNSLSATPTLWRKILMTPGSDGLSLRQITLGGEIADQSILSALALAYPEARIRHIYASTEAGVGFSVTDGKEGFPASFLHRGLPETLLRVTGDGILEIKPPLQGQRYLGEQTPLADSEGYVDTGDRVRIENDRVYFLGRDSGAINVGGNKVQPEKVERVLLQHPAVAMASVGAKRSGITGSLVEAKIILLTGMPDDKSPVPEIRQWCAERLERFEVPALIRVVTEIELNASGKISRNEPTDSAS